MKYVVFTLMRVLQKVPFIKLYQLIEFGEQSILMMPKSGSRSVRDSRLILDGISDVETMSVAKKNYLASKYFRFLTFKQLSKYSKRRKVFYIFRSWDSRIKSCWREKIRDTNGYYFWMYYPFINGKMSEEEFIKIVHKMPESLREKHFSSNNELLAIKSLTLIDLTNLDSLLLDLTGHKVRSNATKE